MRTLSSLLLLLLLCGVSSCQTESLSVGKGINIWHIVLVRMNDPHDEAGKEKIIEQSKAFTAIPGVLSVQAGRIAAGDRMNQGEDFDLAIVMGFRSLQSVHEYVNNPIHKKAVQEVLKPLAKGYTTYDFANE